MKVSIVIAIAALLGACSGTASERSARDERQHHVQAQRASAHDRSEAASAPDAVENDFDRDGDGITDADEANDPNLAADDTGRNERDQNAGLLTPTDQSNSSSDIEITQEIRKKVIDSDELSFNAKNVKIITVGGKVTLRGPVESRQESSLIESSARAVPGVQRVDNQLEIKH